MARVGGGEKQERVSLAAGEEALIEGSETAALQLVDGSIEVAGTFLGTDSKVRVPLVKGGARGVSFYSLEGGTAAISSAAPYRITRFPSQIPTLINKVRNVLLPSQQAQTRSLFVGDVGTGKSYAAKTAANIVARCTQGTACCVFADLDFRQSSLTPAGCVGCAVIPVDGVPGGDFTQVDQCMPVSFFNGNTATSYAAAGNMLVHNAGQVAECAQWLTKQPNSSSSGNGNSGDGAGASSSSSNNAHLIFDCPSFPDCPDPNQYVLHLIEMVGATHVFFVGNSSSSSASTTEPSPFQGLDVEIKRVHRNKVQFIPIPALTPRPYTSEQPLSLYLSEYFIGIPHAPLTCTNVVVPLSSLQFVTTRYVSGVPKVDHLAATTAAGAQQQQQQQQIIKSSVLGRLCAVSHAAIVEEVPFANVAGYVFVRDVDEEHNEVTLITPSVDELFLPRAFLVVDSARILPFPSMDEIMLNSV